MSILRKKSKAGWTTINNDILEDSSLSFRARGLACYLISKPDDWIIKMSHVIREGSEGEKAIRSALHELATAGYLMRTREQGAGGLMTTVTTIADYPAFINEGTAEDRINGYTIDQKTDLPLSDRSVDRPPQNRQDGKGEVLVSTDIPKTDKEEEEKDQTFWTSPRQPLTRKGGKQYPAEEGTTDPSAILVAHIQKLIEQPKGLIKKYMAAQGIDDLSESDRATITAQIDHYLDKTQGRDGWPMGKAAALAYTAIANAEPAPQAHAKNDSTQASHSKTLAMEWATFLGQSTAEVEHAFAAD